MSELTLNEAREILHAAEQSIADAVTAVFQSLQESGIPISDAEIRFVDITTLDDEHRNITLESVRLRSYI